jgi:cytochrome c oxidase cbb3-type subunit 1
MSGFSVQDGRPGGGAAAAHSLGWLVAANAVGVWLAVLLVWPGAGDAFAPLTFGRWAPVHLNGQLYGWCALPLVGALLAWFLDPRHPSVERHAALAVGAWSLALFLGCLAWLGGVASGKPFVDWHGWSRPLLPAAMHVLWAFLAAHTWWRRRRLSRAGLAARLAALGLLLAVPSVLYWASDRSVYPAVNPDSGGATGTALLGSTLALVGIYFALPGLLGLASPPATRRRAVVLGAWLVSWVIFGWTDKGDVSHHAFGQSAALGTLLGWIPLLPWAWGGWSWPAGARPWLRAAAAWWTLLVASGWVSFLPGWSERFKFTHVLVGHSHLAMAGFVASVNGAVLVVLTGRAVGAGVFRAWQAGTVAFVGLMFALGVVEHLDSAGFLGGDGVARLLLALRLVAGVVLAVASFRWWRETCTR